MIPLHKSQVLLGQLTTHAADTATPTQEEEECVHYIHACRELYRAVCELEQPSPSPSAATN